MFFFFPFSAAVTTDRVVQEKLDWPVVKLNSSLKKRTIKCHEYYVLNIKSAERSGPRIWMVRTITTRLTNVIILITGYLLAIT